MNHYTRKRRLRQVFLGWVVGRVVGVDPGVGGEPGWATGPAAGVVLEVPGPVGRRKARRSRGPGGWGRWGDGWRQGNWRQGAAYLQRTGGLLLWRSGVLGGLWEWGGERGPGWLVGGALLRWVLIGVGEVYPELWGRGEYRGLVRVGEWIYRGCFWGLVGIGGAESWGLGAGVGVVGVGEPQVEVERGGEGSYCIRLQGPLQMRVAGDADPFWVRLVLLFLRELEGEEERRGSRATREGRRPLVRQQQIEGWFGVAQPHMSRWEKYKQEGNWRCLLSQKWGEVLTREVQQAVVAVWVRHPSWSAQRVRDRVRTQGVAVTLRQVQQVAEESGWGLLREELRKRWVWGKEGLRPREEWLVEGLLGQVQRLVERLEAEGGLREEERVAVAGWVEEAEEVGLEPREGVWEWFSEEATGPSEEREEAVKGRRETGGNQTGAAAAGGRDGVVRERALELYVSLGSRYRPVARRLGVAASTVYRWVRAWGEGLIPMGALLGVVRSSGVVGVDEKYVLVPKNNKRAGKKKRWMYVYAAVDVYTYDLLHIAIYPYCTRASAQAFLLALRAKGYHPRVLVTDLREDYGPAIAAVYPGAEHHECIFHAEQAVGRMLRQIYGKDYEVGHPEIEALRQEIVRIFQARTKRTAQRRHERIQERQSELVASEPQVEGVFNLLEKHWPKLVNGIESRRIPRTNNAVEQVISRFDQYYQNYRGFESITTAEAFLGVFEKVYRLTPFTADAREEIRGKCPLELAGYDVSSLPWTRVCRAGPEVLEGGPGP